ncbi:MAG: hypothetical protein Q7T20_00490 [Saprospiraceae bacterium]|nr:hypothetical protein [Saprospiraceae bacterium]
MDGNNHDSSLACVSYGFTVNFTVLVVLVALFRGSSMASTGAVVSSFILIVVAVAGGKCQQAEGPSGNC